ncbi:MAG: hypothetical protein JNL08_20425 [Planctomycetes bacterium]|nr:hypothetical protein [Planctomycetota bacterium]
MPRRRRFLGAQVAALVAAACVTTYEEAPLLTDVKVPAVPAVAQTIPFGDTVGADQTLLFEFYGSLFQRLQAAVDDRDRVQLEALLAAYDRPDLPPRIAEVVRGYGAVARALRWQEHLLATATLALPPADGGAPAAPVLGQRFSFDLTLPAPPMPVRLGGRGDDDACGFAVAITLDDTFVDGSTRSTHTQEFAWLPEACAFAGGEPLVVPIELDVAAGFAVRRVVHLRVDLMPGHVEVEGARAPVQRTGIAAATLTLWPAGHEAIARAPLATLREALRRGDAAHFAHVFVAACFVPAADRDAATDLLVEQVRFGRQEQALVAMAALQEVTGVRLPAGDRDAWLAWWQARR